MVTWDALLHLLAPTHAALRDLHTVLDVRQKAKRVLAGMQWFGAVVKESLPRLIRQFR